MVTSFIINVFETLQPTLKEVYKKEWEVKDRYHCLRRLFGMQERNEEEKEEDKSQMNDEHVCLKLSSREGEKEDKGEKKGDKNQDRCCSSCFKLRKLSRWFHFFKQDEYEREDEKEDEIDDQNQTTEFNVVMDR